MKSTFLNAVNKNAPTQISGSMALFDSNLASAAQDLAGGFGLAMVYYKNVDHLGHLYGPESEEIEREVQRVDRSLGLFTAALEELGIRDQTNVALLTDHGIRLDKNIYSTQTKLY